MIQATVLERWTAAMRLAYTFVRGGQKRDLIATHALSQYRAGGGRIRTQDWYTLWRGAALALMRREIITRLPGDYVPPREWLEVRDWQYRRKYILTVTADVRDADDILWPDTSRHVESDVLLTLDEWMEAYDEQIRADPTLYDVVDYTITDVEYIERMS